MLIDFRSVGSYNFSRLDFVLDFLREQELLPFLDLGNYALVCHNMRELSMDYYLEAEDRLDLNHFSRYSEDRESLSLDLTLTEVENGDYRLRIHRVNEDNGSGLRHWQEMDFEPELRPGDVQYLSRLCGSYMTIQTVQAQDRQLRPSYQLQPNEVALLQLFRK